MVLSSSIRTSTTPSTTRIARARRGTRARSRSGPLQLIGQRGVRTPELLLRQQIRLADHSHDAALAFQDGDRADLPLVHQLDDLLVGRLPAYGHGRVRHDVADGVAGCGHGRLLRRTDDQRKLPLP
ncbi:hypothetical protein ADK59_15925 [Streptomyces sp. XY332]|nr:hypothetical protein ADK59_15925 [Streptomyces sp. XY332]